MSLKKIVKKPDSKPESKKESKVMNCLGCGVEIPSKIDRCPTCGSANA